MTFISLTVLPLRFTIILIHEIFFMDDVLGRMLERQHRCCSINISVLFIAFHKESFKHERTYWFKGRVGRGGIDLDMYYRPTRAEISLDALEYNIAAIRQTLAPQCKLLAAVKANAYGHGSVEIAKHLERIKVDYIGVAFLDEAIQLRNAGITTPILVLGYVPAEALALAREHQITISMFREDIRRAAASLPEDANGLKLKVHVKADTGMGRLGLIGIEQTLAFVEACLNTPQLDTEGLFTHYANADAEDKSYTRQQFERFNEIATAIKERGWHLRYVHAANSAAGMETPEFAGNMVRFGIGMYGLYPSIEVNRNQIKLEPVLSLKSEVSFMKKTPVKWGISYGTKYITAGEESIGTVPIGYADGFSRMLTGKAFAIVRGVKVPVRGTICMDQCMIALDDVIGQGDRSDLAGEEVVLIGKQGTEQISADEIADQLGTINYEVVCMITARVPRVYYYQGKIISVKNELIR